MINFLVGTISNTEQTLEKATFEGQKKLHPNNPQGGTGWFW
jgi:hypothetical protein